MKRKQVINTIKSILGKMINREIVFLPRNAKYLIFDGTQNQLLLPIRYTYRASSQGLITYEFCSTGNNLRYTLYTMEFSGREPVIGQTCINLDIASVKPGDILQVNLLDQIVLLNDMTVNCVRHDCKLSRKYIAHLELLNDGHVLSRICSHYLPYENKAIGSDYYFGDDYTNYPLHTNIAYALDLVNQYCSRASLLDVGCALGIYTNAFLEAGFDAYGIDISEFAVNEARKLVPANHIKQCNLDESDIPFDITFDAIWMWDVLEHSANPKMMLEKISNKVSQGSFLFLRTSNSNSLTHRIFESDWEGYSDYSHYGVDKISAKLLITWLKDLGWELLDWKCFGIWIFGNDPIVLQLRKVFNNIPELAVLLFERDLGDNIQLVARKR